MRRATTPYANDTYAPSIASARMRMPVGRSEPACIAARQRVLERPGRKTFAPNRRPSGGHEKTSKTAVFRVAPVTRPMARRPLIGALGRRCPSPPRASKIWRVAW